MYIIYVFDITCKNLNLRGCVGGGGGCEGIKFKIIKFPQES